MTIYQKLSKIQQEFKSKKSRYNSFGKYYFRSAEDILEATKPFLKELDAAVTINEELISHDPPVLKVTARLMNGKAESGLDTHKSAQAIGYCRCRLRSERYANATTLWCSKFLW